MSRILCFLADIIIVSLPIHLFFAFVMKVSNSQFTLLSRLLIAVYNVILIECWHGQTVGKYFGKLKVVSKEGQKAEMINTGIREMIKSLYLIPIIGWLLASISMIMLFFNGQTLHDVIGKSKESFIWEKENIVDGI